MECKCLGWFWVISMAISRSKINKVELPLLTTKFLTSKILSFYQGWRICTSWGYYTWTNGRTFCKLDRVIVNKKWLEQDNRWIVDFQTPRCLSDHTPCLVSMLTPSRPRKKAFKFYNIWTTTHANFATLVSNGWQQVEQRSQLELSNTGSNIKWDSWNLAPSNLTFSTSSI